MDNIFLPFLQLNLFMAVLAIAEAVPEVQAPEATAAAKCCCSPFLAAFSPPHPPAGLLGRHGDNGEDGSVGSDWVTVLPC